MSTKKIAIATTVGVLALAALLFALPVMAASGAFSTPRNSSQPQSVQHQKVSLTVGEAFALTSTAGGYKEIGNPAVNGTATGSLSLQVTGVFEGGYSLSVTGGHLSFNGTTYTMTGGSAELGPYGVRMAGQAQAGPSAQMLFAGRDLGRFGTASYGVLRVDLTSGTLEFGVRLLVAISAT